MEKNEYKCARCGNVYEKGWSDEEAEKEANEIWGNIPKEERVVICDNCRIYQCPHCNFWHLTSKPEGRKFRQRRK